MEEFAEHEANGKNNQMTIQMPGECASGHGYNHNKHEIARKERDNHNILEGKNMRNEKVRKSSKLTNTSNLN